MAKRKMVQNNTQLEYLDKRMSQIFRKNGFPAKFFNDMLGEIDRPEKEERTDTNV